MQSLQASSGVVISFLGRVRASDTLKTFLRCYRGSNSCQHFQIRSLHFLARKDYQDQLQPNFNQTSHFTKLNRNLHHNLKNDENQDVKNIKGEKGVHSNKIGKQSENLSHDKAHEESASSHDQSTVKDDTAATDPLHDQSTVKDDTAATVEPAKEGILLRFKNTYKRHGKICIAVHLLTSSVWAGSFYYLVANGVDIVEVLRWMDLSQSIIDKFTSPSLGHLATTYLLYKLASPLRYTVTIGGTHWIVKYLQRSGKMPATPEENKIRSLLKEGGVKMKPSSKKPQN